LNSTKLLKSNTTFKGDVLRLATGTGIAQIIGILSMPILARLYAPEAFGVTALFVSLTTIFGVLACMRYELSIVLPENDSEAANLLGVSLLFTLIITFCTALIIWFGSTFILGWINMSELAPYLWLIPIGVLFQGLFTAFNYWNTRTKHFTRLSIANVSKQISNTTGTLGAGFAGYATGGAMIVANVGSQVIATIVLGGQILRDNAKFLIKSINWRKMTASMKRYRKFPIYSSWSILLNTISWQLPALILGVFFSPKIVGYYALGFRVIQMPMQLIGQAISQVFIQRAAKAKNENKLTPLVDELIRHLFVIGLFPALLLSIIGKDLFVIIFGYNWLEAGVYSQILSVFGLIWFVSSPMSTLFSVLGMQKIGLKVQFVILSTRIIALLTGVYFNDGRLAIILFSISGIVSYCILLILILDKADIHFMKLWRFLYSLIMKTSPFLFIILIVSLSSENSTLILLFSLFTTFLYYFVNKDLIFRDLVSGSPHNG